MDYQFEPNHLSVNGSHVNRPSLLFQSSLCLMIDDGTLVDIKDKTKFDRPISQLRGKRCDSLCSKKSTSYHYVPTSTKQSCVPESNTHF